ncbi:hypothetical protein AB4225_05465 [Streptomyces sp. 2RAF24]|uniref:hypothetical protein n=1 Tax=Streptomyces sp. 2RAF24 TaxID=3232997 RepID=UPI003F987AAC
MHHQMCGLQGLVERLFTQVLVGSSGPAHLSDVEGLALGGVAGVERGVGEGSDAVDGVVAELEHPHHLVGGVKGDPVVAEMLVGQG